MKRIENKNKKNILALSLFILLLVLGVIGSYYVVHQPVKPVTLVSGEFLPEGKDAEKISDDILKKESKKEVDRSKFNMVIASEAVFETGDKPGDLAIQNPPNNAYPINVEIRRDDNHQLIYTSGAIQPGQEIKTVTLENQLPKGEYQTTAKFSIYDNKTKTKKGDVAAKVVVIVKN